MPANDILGINAPSVSIRGARRQEAAVSPGWTGGARISGGSSLSGVRGHDRTEQSIRSMGASVWTEERRARVGGREGGSSLSNISGFSDFSLAFGFPAPQT